MTFRVDLTSRATRDLTRLYRRIDAQNHDNAALWFNGLEAAIFSLDANPARGAPTPEDPGLRQLFYGAKPRFYRIIYKIDEGRRLVTVLHIRYGARQAFAPE